MEEKKMKRKSIMLFALILLVCFSVYPVGEKDKPEAKEVKPELVKGKYFESPMLKAKVAAGKLPAVDERLPEEPLVVEPVEEIGQHGGTVYAVSSSPNSLQDAMMTLSRP